MNGYCIKCHDEREIEDPKKIIAKDRKRWLKGLCPECGTVIWHRLPSEQRDLDLVVAYHLP